MAASSTDLERVVCDCGSFLGYATLKSKQLEAINEQKPLVNDHNDVNESSTPIALVQIPKIASPIHTAHLTRPFFPPPHKRIKSSLGNETS